MTLFGNTLRYGAVAQIFHWVTAILVAWTWLIAGTWERGGEDSAVMALHQTLGFTIFVLVLARLAWRMFDTRPETPAMPTAMAIVGKATHWLLFGLLIAVPLSAIVGSWLEGNAITVYGQAL